MLLEFSCYKNFKVYQMDVNYAFLNGNLREEVFIEQPEVFLLSKNGTKKGTLWSQAIPKSMVLKDR